MIRVVRGGASSTLQDLGRPPAQRWGVPRGGAADRPAHQLANLLVGNDIDCATIEMTMIGDTFEVLTQTLVAWTGADLGLRVEYLGKNSPMPSRRPVLLQAGCRILGSSAARGCRAYLAVSGGFDVPLILGSRSTELRGQFGGWQGRKLRTGDHLSAGKPGSLSQAILQKLSVELTSETGFASVHWFHTECDSEAAPQRLRLLPGKHFPSLVDADQLYQMEYVISPRSDRMGYRLSGSALKFSAPLELLSTGLVPGTLQLPMDGQPILILADGAPTGGYPQIGYVISADMGLAAQLRPGDVLGFVRVDMKTAQLALRNQAAHLNAIENSIRLWARKG